MTAASVRKAADMLGLGERASMNEIKSAYRAMLKRWHPDTAVSNDEKKNNTMTMRIQDAYELLLRYCSGYRYQFDGNDTAENAEAFWMRRFGDDHVWGNK